MRRPTGFLYLLTLTAPGRTRHRIGRGALRQQAERGAAPPDHSVWCPCTPAGGVDLAEWNASHSRRWNRLRTRLRQLHPDLEYFRGVEVQKRGALHDHAMVWSPQELSLETIRRLAVACGFGHEVDLAECAPGSQKAAYYVSKYVTKATDSRDLVPWQAVDLDTGEIVSVAGRYRTWSMSRRWGLTMAQVRAQAREYARSLADNDADRSEVAALRVLLAALGPLGVVVDESPGSDPP